MSEQALMIAAPAAPTPAVTAEQVELIKRTVAQGATDEELKLFFFDCQRHGVHPLDRMIHFTKRNNRYTPITSIDFMRARAAETGEMAGSDDAVFGTDAEDRVATVTVYRMTQGQRFPYVATARWSEYFPGEALGFMWKKMPHTMLGKCAEALALRKAFPKQLQGLYAREEMDQAGRTEVVDVRPASEPPAATNGAARIPDSFQADPKPDTAKAAEEAFAPLEIGTDAEIVAAFEGGAKDCPACGGKGTIIRGKKEYGGGWVCWARDKSKACGSKWSARPLVAGGTSSPASPTPTGSTTNGDDDTPYMVGAIIRKLNDYKATQDERQAVIRELLNGKPAEAAAPADVKNAYALVNDREAFNQWRTEHQRQ